MHPDALFDAAVYEVYVNGVFGDGLREDDSFMSLLAELNQTGRTASATGTPGGIGKMRIRTGFSIKPA